VDAPRHHTTDQLPHPTTRTAADHPAGDQGKGVPVTLLAWDREELLPGFDRDKIVGFYRAYVDKGPERVP